MRWTFGDDDFQRGPNMRLAEVARHGMSIAFADHDMKMEGRLAVQLGDVAQQGCYLHLLAHRNLRVILLLPIEVLKHNVACRMAVLSALHEPTASRPVSGYPSERHSLFFGFATLGGRPVVDHCCCCLFVAALSAVLLLCPNQVESQNESQSSESHSDRIASGLSCRT